MKISILLLFLSVSVYGFVMPPVNIIDSRIKHNPKLVYSSSTVYNDSIYVYGGTLSLSIKNGSSHFFKYDLNEKTMKLDLSMVNTTNDGPECIECQPIHLPGTLKFLLLIADAKATASSTGNRLFQPFIFDFDTLTWTDLTSTATYNGGERGNDAFWARSQHRVILGKDGNAYIFGGIPYADSTICPLSIISYNISTNTFNVVAQDAPDCFVAANAYTTREANDEITLILGGMHNGTVQTFNNNSYGYYDQNYFAFTNQTHTFHTTTGEWSYASIAGTGPSVMYAAASSYNPVTNLLHIFGGAYSDAESEGLETYSTIWTMNTTTEHERWYSLSYGSRDETVVDPNVDARGFVTSVILKDKYFITFYGQTIQLAYYVSLPEIDIFKLPETVDKPDTYPMTLKSVAPPKSTKDKVSILALQKKWQFLIVIAIIAAIILLWILIVFVGQWCGNIDNATDVLIKTLYDRRIGEPIWTEILHCLCRIISFVIIVLYIIYCYDNVANSTVSTTSKFESLESITFPDIRFCFTGWNSTTPYDNHNVLQCTVKGESFIAKRNCNDYLSQLDPDVQSPLYDYSEYTVQCFLFKSNSSLVATEDRPTLTFSIIRDESFISDDTIIYVNAYPIDEDPNRYLFFNEPLPVDWTQDRLERWAQVGDNSLQSIDTFSYININDSLAVTFETKTHKNLNPYGAWNYIGSLFPSYIPTENFTQTYTHRAKIPDGTSIELSPATFDKEIITYKRDNTILGAIATAGGILGLITTVMILLFGGRPSGAWGLLHILFRKRHEKMLSDTLDTRLFNTKSLKGQETAYVPLATPVESRFIRAFNEINQFQYELDHTHKIDEETDLEKRLMRLEARNQMMEIVLKSYYIDDHIFHTLNAQRELNPEIGRSLSSYFPKNPSGDASPVSVDTTQNTSINENVFVDEQKGKNKSRFSFKFM